MIWGWYNRPNNGFSAKWTQSHPLTKTIKIYFLEFKLDAV
jgi:hypothetical protein